MAGDGGGRPGRPGHDGDPGAAADGGDDARAAAAADRGALAQARAGSDEAALRLLERHGSSMLATAWRVLGTDRALGEDAVQEAWLKALTTAALPRGDVGGWLRAIAARAALDLGRSRRRRAEVEIAPPGAPGEPAAPPSSPQARLDLGRALEALAPADRAVLVLVELEGLSMAEAAQALGISRTAAKLRAFRARRRLRSALSPESSPEEPAIRHTRRSR